MQDLGLSKNYQPAGVYLDLRVIFVILSHEY